MKLQLYTMRDETTLALLKGIDEQAELNVTPETCFWLGSVSCDNKAAFQTFIKAAEQENIIELRKHTSIDDHVAYAVMVRDAHVGTRFHLFVIELGRGLWTDPKLLFGKTLSNEYSVATKPKTTVPDGILTHPKLEVWKSFIGGFFRK